MLEFHSKINRKTKEIFLELALFGQELLNNASFNKGSAFTAKERALFKLDGLLPQKIEPLKSQVKRAYAQYQSYNTSLQKNIFLQELHNTNQILFYRLVKDHIVEILPILYTPTVGKAVQNFNQEFRRPFGLYIPFSKRHKIGEILKNRQFKEIDLIVITDSERILGLGDQGIGGIHIPIAKLMLYSLLAGIDPKRTLPIVLDLGTNNEKLRQDPLYLGSCQKRITGKKYDEFIANVVFAIKKEFPKIFLHWEDFGRDHAMDNLEKFRNQICSFNDDIQGTAVVTLAAILSALKISKQKLTEQRIVFLGAGSAGTGIAEQIKLAMQYGGINEKEANKKFWLVDKLGLLTENLYNLNPNNITPAQQKFLRTKSDYQSWQVKDQNNITLFEVVKNVRPTILIGCAGVGGAFNKELIAELIKHVAKPIILPLSNPTEKSEAKPEDILKWTSGRALIATGSPFAPITFNNKKYEIAQCNNAFAFPGLGLGVIATKAHRVSDTMLWQAALSIVAATLELGDPKAILPNISQAEKVARKVALAVAQQAIKEGLTDIKESNEKQIQKLIENVFWKIEYPILRKK